jgi:hypothetical protein
VVIFDGRRYAVQFEGSDLAWFDASEKSNATDFCNGFNAGYMRGKGITTAAPAPEGETE